MVGVLSGELKDIDCYFRGVIGLLGEFAFVLSFIFVIIIIKCFLVYEVLKVSG